MINQEIVKVQTSQPTQAVQLATLERKPGWKLAPGGVRQPFFPGEPSVGSILRHLHPSPYASLLVGLRSTGRLCFLDLTRPECSPVLVLGDRAVGKTHQLQVMVASALHLSLPHETQVVVISCHPAPPAESTGAYGIQGVQL